MIDGVIIKPLKKIPDGRGCIYKMQENSDPEFKGFGEIYFSTIYPGIVKGWHKHKTAVLNYTVIQGMIRLVLCDLRPGSLTYNEIQEIYLGDQAYSLVQIPAQVWNGFQCIGNQTSIVADLINVNHNEDEMERLDPHVNDLIKFDWRIKDK